MTCASFDIFGTCLLRRVTPPSRVFHQVGERFARARELPAPEEFAEQFAGWRLLAERRARSGGSGEDPPLEAIWAELRRLAGSELPGDAGPQAELDAERSVIVPCGARLAEVEAARARGRRILFVSDMYLPAAFLASLLREFGFLREGDALYVSAEVGASKRSGRLFRHVLAEERIAPGELEHAGDDPWADFEVPRRMGIASRLVVGSEVHAAANLLVRQRPAPSARRWLDAVGAIELARHAAPPSPTSAPDFSRLVENHLGPFFCLFGHWVLGRARRDGVERLHFAARDCRLAWAACRVLSASGGPPVDCRYLQISRQAVYLASGTDLSPAGMPWLNPVTSGATVPALAARLELDAGLFTRQWRLRFPDWRPNQRLSTREEWAALWETLGAEPIRELLRSSIARRRSAALDYFGQCGLLEPVRAGLVDLGSLLYCQEAVNRIRASAGPQPPLGGYYLYLKNPDRGPAEAGPAQAMFRFENYLPAMPARLSWLDRTNEVEHIFGLADHPSVRSYEPGGAVAFVEAPPSIGQAAFASLESALIGYTRVYGPAWKELAESADGADATAEIVKDCLEHPDSGTAQALRSVRYPVDSAHRDLRPLVAPWSWTDLVRELLPGRAASARLWPEASLAGTPPARRAVLALERRFRLFARRLRTQP